MFLATDVILQTCFLCKFKRQLFRVLLNFDVTKILNFFMPQKLFLDALTFEMAVMSVS